MSQGRAVWMAVILVSLVSLACANLGGPKALPVGEEAPNFGVRLRGGTVTLEDLLGQVVVVSFWSST